MSGTTLYKKLPHKPGVYLMRGARGKLLYVGKAGDLYRRVASYFTRPHDVRIERLVSEIRKIDYQETDSALEALILEASLIKKLRPPYNVKEKDDKSFLYIEITKEQFPRVLLVRGRGALTKGCPHFGPFVNAAQVRAALKVIRKIFPFNTHPADKIGSYKRPCLDAEIGLCPGTCTGEVSATEYRRTIRHIMMFLKGEKKKLLSHLEREMERASKELKFERAAELRRKVFALRHIRDVAFLGEEYQVAGMSYQKEKRIEGYDISNISGTFAVGAMVVFRGDKPDKNEYRKFKIQTIEQSDDVGMMKEMLMRRFARAGATTGGSEWELPDLVLVDGGRGQVNIAKEVLDAYGLRIPVVGIAKGPKRNKNEIIGHIPAGITEQALVRARDEAHRFAVKYHRSLRGRAMRGE